MRRFFRLFSVLLAALVLLAACAATPSVPPSDGPGPMVSGLEPQPSGAQLALFGTEARLADTFGQGAWLAVSKYAGEAGLTCAPYKTTAENAEAVLSTLDLAAKGGARLIVCIDSAVSRVVLGAARQYPDVDFILVDGQNPAPENLPENTVLVNFSPAQAGWLAGYVALAEHPAALRLAQCGTALSQACALGFLLGAQAAAAEQNLEAGSVPVARLELSQELTEDACAEQLRALLGRDENPDAGPLFVADSALSALALNAASAADVSVIGIDVDMAAGASALASIRFDAKNLISDLLADWGGGTFPGGGVRTGGIYGGSVWLDLTPFRLQHLGEDAAQRLADKFTDGSLARSLARKLALDEDGLLPAPEDLGLTCLNLHPDAGEEGEDILASSETPPTASSQTPSDSL